MEECLSGSPHQRPTFEEIELHMKRLDAENVEPGDAHLSMLARKNMKASRNEDLLYEVFPRHVAEALRDGRKVEPEKKEMVSIFFSDVVGFTNISASVSPAKVQDMLDRLYLRFDDLSHKHDVHKMETVGDAYLCVTNRVKDQEHDHAKRIAEFATDAVKAANETLVDVDNPSMGHVQIRVGMHSGPVIASVVGSRLPKYSMFGDTVNSAARMESNSQPGRIQCSERSAELLKKQCPEMPLLFRGEIEVKGKGKMSTYFVNEEKVATAVQVQSPPIISQEQPLEPIPDKETAQETGRPRGVLTQLYPMFPNSEAAQHGSSGDCTYDRRAPVAATDSESEVELGAPSEKDDELLQLQERFERQRAQILALKKSLANEAV